MKNDEKVEARELYFQMVEASRFVLRFSSVSLANIFRILPSSNPINAKWSNRPASQLAQGSFDL